MFFFSDQGISYINLNNTVKNKNYTTTVGTSFKFIVKVDAYPQPVHYEWFHDETEIVNDTKHSVIFSQKEAMLRIPNVNIRDNGIYMLRATNSKLTETLNFTLNVLGKSHYLLITFRLCYNWQRKKIGKASSTSSATPKQIDTRLPSQKS